MSEGNFGEFLERRKHGWAIRWAEHWKTPVNPEGIVQVEWEIAPAVTVVCEAFHSKTLRDNYDKARGDELLFRGAVHVHDEFFPEPKFHRKLEDAQAAAMKVLAKIVGHIDEKVKQALTDLEGR